MEKIYPEQHICGEFEIQKETIDFLLNYSKSLSYVKVGDLAFENIAN